MNIQKIKETQIYVAEIANIFTTLNNQMIVAIDRLGAINGEIPVGKPVSHLDKIGKRAKRRREIFDLLGTLTTRQIAKKLNIEKKTVEAHRDILKKELNIGSAKELAKFARQTLTEKRA